MAFVEIPEEPLKRFLDQKQTFAKVGDTFDGVYLSDSENERGYGIDYIFKIDGVDAACLTQKGVLKGQLEKAKRDGKLKPGARVRIQLAKFTDVGKESPMKNFKVAVDPDYKGSPPKNNPNVKFKEKPKDDFAAGAGFTPDEDVPF